MAGSVWWARLCRGRLLAHCVSSGFLTGSVLPLLPGSLFFNLPHGLDKAGLAFEQAKDCIRSFVLDYLSAFPPNDDFWTLAQKFLQFGLCKACLLSDRGDSLGRQQAEFLSHFILHGD